MSAAAAATGNNADDRVAATGVVPPEPPGGADDSVRGLWMHAHRITAEAESDLQEKLLAVKAARSRFSAATARLAACKSEVVRNSDVLRRAQQALLAIKRHLASLEHELVRAEANVGETARQVPTLRAAAREAEKARRGEARRQAVELAAMRGYVEGLKEGRGVLAARVRAEEAGRKADEAAALEEKAAEDKAAAETDKEDEEEVGEEEQRGGGVAAATAAT
jgi:hypothetical protein